MNNSEIIDYIATTSININDKTKSLENILLQIIEWIDLIIKYGTLLDDEMLFKNFDLHNEDFTYDERIASIGKEYYNWKILPSDFHENGEKWNFEKLVIVSNTGLVDWYCKKFNYNQEIIYKIVNDTTVKILGAFYHRMKIIIENINLILDFMTGKSIYNFFDLSKITKLQSKKDFIVKYPLNNELCIKIKDYCNNYDEIFIKYLVIEKATDLAQLALFNYIKNIYSIQ
jgi:hypothetical protein